MKEENAYLSLRFESQYLKGKTVISQLYQAVQL
jgi:hypothetical protein